MAEAKVTNSGARCWRVSYWPKDWVSHTSRLNAGICTTKSIRVATSLPFVQGVMWVETAEETARSCPLRLAAQDAA